jgi:hypothetical protein
LNGDIYYPVFSHIIKITDRAGAVRYEVPKYLSFQDIPARARSEGYRRLRREKREYNYVRLA